MDSYAPAVLGLPSLNELDLIRTVNLIKANTEFLNPKFDDLFCGLGHVTDIEYDIKLKPGAIGNVVPCRNVAISLVEKFKTELDRMLKLKVIKRVNEPTEWVNSFVIVRK